MLAQQLDGFVAPVFERRRIERRQPTHQPLPVGTDLTGASDHLVINRVRPVAGVAAFNQLQHIRPDLAAVQWCL